MADKALKQFFVDFFKKFKFEISSFYSLVVFADFIYLFGSSYLLKIITNNVKDRNFQLITILCLLYCFSNNINYLTRIVHKKIEYLTRKKLDKYYILQYFGKTLKHEEEFFTNNLTGQLTTKLFNIQKKIEHIFAYGSDVVSNLLSFFIGIGFLYFTNHLLSIFSLIWFVIYCIIMIFLIKWKFKIGNRNAEQKSKSLGIINDCFVNIVNIKIFSSEKSESRKVKKCSLDILRSENELIFCSNIKNIIKYFMMGIFVFVSLSIVFISYINNKTSLGTIAFVSQFSLTIIFWVNYGIKQFFEIIDNISSINNSLKTLTTDIKIKNKLGAKKLVLNEGKIIFKNLRFSYDK